MVKLLSMLVIVAMVFSFSCGGVMAAEQQTAKQAGNKIVKASKATGKGIERGTVATGKAVGHTVMNTGTAVVGVSKAVVGETAGIVKPVTKLGNDAATELEASAKGLDENK